ncbi:MAG TPA: C25 family cysteine peptidase, partial [Adhaeribacter sp.]|nr:C25 family cysteine peptidase [Adhaeribacter sp.]
MRHSYYRVIYPQQPDLQNNNQVIFTDSAKTGPSYFLFSNAPANAVAYDITDSYNVSRTTGVDVGGQKGFVIDPASFKRRIFVANEQNFISPASITRPNFTSLAGGTSANYIIVTHPILHQPVPGTPYNDPPADYAAYRSSPAGGGYSTFVADMDQLYDQFHYGEHSPYAIAQFMDWVRVNGQPEYLLLMGKGIEQSFHAGNYRKNPNAYPTKNLVPAIGDKPSDILITADWRNNNYVPRVATGRLAVNNSAEIVAYLDKVKGHTLLGIEEWRKNVLHLGGGTNAGEISLFRRYLENYENKIEGPLLGAKVETKIRPNSGQTTAFINVKNEVNTGLSLITFFGHSSSTTSDLDIGYVSDPIFGYNNQDKYPMILMNGCIAGNAFHPIGGNQKYSFGEDWIMTPKKGAILFLADVAMAIPSALNNYSNQFYTTAFTDSAFYGKTIGEIQRETIRRTINTSPNNFENLMVANQMLLQGDPAVRLFAPERPDYLVKANGLRLQSIPAGTAVTASLEQFNLLIDVKNNGKAIEDSLVISVKRTLPNGDTIRYAGVKFPPVFNEATYPFPIDSRNVNGFGTNKFEVFLDYGNNIDELNENNNTAELNQYLTINGVVALLPKEFSIVSGPKVTLIGQPANLLAQP